MFLKRGGGARHFPFFGSISFLCVATFGYSDDFFSPETWIISVKIFKSRGYWDRERLKTVLEVMMVFCDFCGTGFWRGQI